MDLMGILALDADKAKARGYTALFEQLHKAQQSRYRTTAADHRLAASSPRLPAPRAPATDRGLH